MYILIIKKIFGNPNVMHEACGYGMFEKDMSKKLKNFDFELCLRWIQTVSIQPFAKFNNIEIFAILEERKEDAQKLNIAFRTRLTLAIYIYSYMLKNSIDVKLI